MFIFKWKPSNHQECYKLLKSLFPQVKKDMKGVFDCYFFSVKWVNSRKPAKDLVLVFWYERKTEGAAKKQKQKQTLLYEVKCLFVLACLFDFKYIIYLID